MPSAAQSARYTWDDFVALEEDDLRELIDGELVEVEVWVGLQGADLRPARRDAGLGVPEYWLIDPRERTLECLVVRDGHYSIAATHTDEETFCPASFEGLQIPLAKLWE